ncbi:hypothetical protein FGB62_11g215 [Gracilaria domingensis]|nr:hypothetical protein FGB62_11g215 [Gracilaria domingensis]
MVDPIRTMRNAGVASGAKQNSRPDTSETTMMKTASVFVSAPEAREKLEMLAAWGNRKRREEIWKELHRWCHTRLGFGDRRSAGAVPSCEGSDCDDLSIVVLAGVG